MKSKFFPYVLLSCIPLIGMNAAEASKTPAKITRAPEKSIRAFTGKVVGKHVRLRTLPDLESFVVKELGKSELLVIDGEKNDFYSVVPLQETKAYVFRSFILDNIVEGNRVNVRLKPDLDAPIIGHLTSGQHIDGEICQKSHKWLQIAPPKETRFYVAKEYIEQVGGPELKAAHEKRKTTASGLIDSAQLLTQAEFRKPFEEINIDRLTRNYQTVINDYSDFPEFAEKAKANLAAANENYLQKKLAYLEAKASRLGAHFASGSTSSDVDSDSVISSSSPTDRMHIWEPIEKAIYLTWATMHHSKTMDDYYKDQRLQAVTISGLLEAYPDPVMNKPGDYMLKERDLPLGYLYSTHLDLEQYVGRNVKFIVTPRPNNNFAFPAYYVIGIE